MTHKKRPSKGSHSKRSPSATTGGSTSAPPREAPEDAGTRPLDTRAHLLQSAKRVFFEKGYDGATVKDLADAAQVNVSLISYYFGGKEGLYHECLTQFGRERFEFAERMLPADGEAVTSLENFQVRLTLFISEFIEAHLREPEVSGILHRNFGCGSVELLKGFGNIFMRHFEAIVKFISAAQKNGVLRGELSSEQSAAILMGGIVHTIRMEPVARHFYQKSLQDPDLRAEFTRTAVSIFISGCAAKKKPHTQR